MKIKLGELRKIIREAAVSPAVFTNNKLVSDPMEKKGIAKAMGDLERTFNDGLKMNLVVAHADKYNKETREFDDAMMQKIKETADEATETTLSKINDVLKERWMYALHHFNDRSQDYDR